MKPEKYQADIVGLTTHFEKHECQRLQLFHREYGQVVVASQEDERGEIKDAAKSPNGASHQAEERR